MRLSRVRAEAIRKFLIEKGIDPSRIEADGRGLAGPLNGNGTDEERRQNRRVELTILYE